MVIIGNFREAGYLLFRYPAFLSNYTFWRFVTHQSWLSRNLATLNISHTYSSEVASRLVGYIAWRSLVRIQPPLLRKQKGTAFDAVPLFFPKSWREFNSDIHIYFISTIMLPSIKFSWLLIYDNVLVTRIRRSNLVMQQDCNSLNTIDNPPSRSKKFGY